MIGAEWVRERTRGTYYGWWIVAAGIAIQAITTGLLMQAYGAYVVVMQAEFGWSRTAFSLGFAIQRVESGLLGPIQGWMLDRWGPRPVMTAGMILFGVGFMLFSQITSLWMFYGIFFVMAVGASLAGFPSITATIVNWFARLRSTAMGIVHVGMGIGGLMVPAVAYSLNTYGWRATAFGSGVLIILIGVPAAQFFRHTPEQYGLLPDGEEVKRDENADDDSPPAPLIYDDSKDFTVRQAVRTPAFWLLSLGHSMGVLVVGVVMVHAVVHMNEGLGYSLTRAAFMISLLTSVSIIGNLIGGFLGDRLNKRLLATVCMLGSGTALIILGWADTFWMVAAFSILQGLAHGIRGVLMMPLRADYFGRKSIATIMGFSSMIVMFGMMSGPVIAGVMADSIGDYRLAFTILGAITFAGSLCFFFARKPVHPREKRAQQAAA
ncbi:MAG: MFS transporter [Thermomicrobiaceae bacterium]